MSDIDQYLLDNNLLGLSDYNELLKQERLINQKAIRDLIKSHSEPESFNYDYLKSIHKKLFENIYRFAGKDREDLGIEGYLVKGGDYFIPGEEVKQNADKIFTLLKNAFYFKGSTRSELVEQCAYFYKDLNSIHPFREGNGRTQREFIRQLTKSAGYEIDLTLVSKESFEKTYSVPDKERHSEIKRVFLEALDLKEKQILEYKILDQMGNSNQTAKKTNYITEEQKQSIKDINLHDYLIDFYNFTPYKDKGRNGLLSPDQERYNIFLHRTKQTEFFKNFSNDKSGDIIQFVMNAEGLSFIDASKKIIQDLNIISHERVKPKQQKQIPK